MGAKTFRDTPQCRELVYDYGCKSLSDYAQDASHILRPCKSFCVMVAVTCANSIAWHTLCQDLKCPPEGEFCLPYSPYIIEAVDPSKACEIFIYATPDDGWSGIPSGARRLAITAGPAMLALTFGLMMGALGA